jgi:hypothetical protein
VNSGSATSQSRASGSPLRNSVKKTVAGFVTEWVSLPSPSGSTVGPPFSSRPFTPPHRTVRGGACIHGESELRL